MGTRQAPGAGVETLAEALAGRLTSPPRSILVLSRNDLEPARAIEARFPDARVTTRTKADFQGMGAFAILRSLRSDAHDLFVLQDGVAEFDRLIDLYRLASLGVRSGRRVLMAATVRRGRLAPGWRLEDVAPGRVLPGLLFRLAREVAATIPLLLATPLMLRAGPRKREPRHFSGAAPYRITYLRTDFSFGIAAGGSVTHISGVTGGMKEAGHGVDFISSDDIPGVAGGGTQVDVIEPGHTIRVFDEAAIVAYHHRFVSVAKRILSRRRPDLLYQRHSVFNAAGAWLAKALGIPLILEANNSEVWARARWSRLLLRRLAEGMERSAFQGADVIVTVSKIGADQIVALGADRDRVLVNPNGVDPERFHPGVDGAGVREQYGFGSGDVVCGFIGTFTRWHGVLFLADQAAAVAARHPGVRFLFMGDGDLRSAVEDGVEGAGITDRCRFTGLISHGDVPEHLAACDVLISPHLPFQDGTPFFGSPTKLFEYMAMGRAVVASNLGQIGEVIEDGRSGILYSPGSAPEFQAAMDRVIGDSGLRMALATAARERVIQNYTWRRNAERALAFLEERLAHGKGAA